MRNISKTITVLVILSLFMAFFAPVSAQTDNNQKYDDQADIIIDLFAKEKIIKSGEKAYFVAKLTDEAGNPVTDKTVCFYQNIEVSGLSVDQYIGEAATDEKGIAVFRPALSVAGDSGVMFVGCAAENTAGDAFYSDHVMITVINPYPVISDNEIL